MQTPALKNSQVAPNNAKKLLEALAQSKVYRQYERTFVEATGLPLALRPVEFFGLPFQGKKNENGFCAFLAGKGSCSLCLQTQGRCANKPGEQPRSLQCAFGLTETRVPVRMGGRVIGFLATGQVFTRPPKAAVFKKSIGRFFAHGSAAEKKAAQLWKQSPSMAPSRYEATVQLLSFFANQLSSLSNQIVTEQANAERVVARLHAAGLAGAFIFGPPVTRSRLYRVRIGPVGGVPEFDQLIARLDALGYPGARLVAP